MNRRNALFIPVLPVVLLLYFQHSLATQTDSKDERLAALLTSDDIPCFYFPLSSRCNDFATDLTKSGPSEYKPSSSPIRLLIIEPQDKTVSIPTNINVIFQTQDQSAMIDLPTVNVWISKKFLNGYLPRLNVTNRVRPYLTTTGIVWKKASVPPGEYKFYVSALDTQGRQLEESFDIKAIANK